MQKGHCAVNKRRTLVRIDMGFPSVPAARLVDIRVDPPRSPSARDLRLRERRGTRGAVLLAGAEGFIRTETSLTWRENSQSMAPVRADSS